MVGEIEDPGFLEGGDYFAAGEDLALVGVGLRSNIEACEQLMDRGWLGTDRLAVVRDDFEQHQVNKTWSTGNCGRSTAECNASMFRLMDTSSIALPVNRFWHWFCVVLMAHQASS